MGATEVYWDILGLYRDNGRENGSYYSRDCSNLFSWLMSNVNMWVTTSGRQAREHKAHHFNLVVLELSVCCQTLAYELRTKFRLGGTYRGLNRVLGGPIKGYAANLVHGSYAATTLACVVSGLGKARFLLEGSLPSRAANCKLLSMNSSLE